MRRARWGLFEGGSGRVQSHRVAWNREQKETTMRLLNRLLILSAVLLATGCVLEPLDGPGYYNSSPPSYNYYGHYHYYDRDDHWHGDRDDHRSHRDHDRDDRGWHDRDDHHHR